MGITPPVHAPYFTNFDKAGSGKKRHSRIASLVSEEYKLLLDTACRFFDAVTKVVSKHSNVLNDS